MRRHIRSSRILCSYTIQDMEDYVRDYEENRRLRDNSRITIGLIDNKKYQIIDHTNKIGESELVDDVICYASDVDKSQVKELCEKNGWRFGEYFSFEEVKESRRVRGRKVTASKRNQRRPIMSSVEVIDGVKFDFWHDNTFDDVCDADCRFYPNGGYYAGNIYDCSGEIIGDYIGTDSVAIERLFPGIFGD